VVAFPAHIVVAADLDRGWLGAHTIDGDYGTPMSPAFLGALERRIGLCAGNLDVVLLAEPVPGPPPIPLTPLDEQVHPRVARALRYRRDVRVWSSERGVLILGRGLAGRWEAAIEVREPARNAGHGRALAAAARHLVPDGRPVWAQVAPGNASSLRTFLAAGYLPVGSEVLLTPFTPEAPIRHP
jgi:hypothetical protein